MASAPVDLSKFGITSGDITDTRFPLIEAWKQAGEELQGVGGIDMQVARAWEQIVTTRTTISSEQFRTMVRSMHSINAEVNAILIDLLSNGPTIDEKIDIDFPTLLDLVQQLIGASASFIKLFETATTVAGLIEMVVNVKGVANAIASTMVEKLKEGTVTLAELSKLNGVSTLIAAKIVEKLKEGTVTLDNVAHLNGIADGFATFVLTQLENTNFVAATFAQLSKLNGISKLLAPVLAKKLTDGTVTLKSVANLATIATVFAPFALKNLEDAGFDESTFKLLSKLRGISGPMEKHVLDGLTSNPSTIALSEVGLFRVTGSLEVLAFRMLAHGVDTVFDNSDLVIFQAIPKKMVLVFLAILK